MKQPVLCLFCGWTYRRRWRDVRQMG